MSVLELRNDGTRWRSRFVRGFFSISSKVSILFVFEQKGLIDCKFRLTNANKYFWNFLYVCGISVEVENRLLVFSNI